MNGPYLYLATRGMAKTYELIRFAINEALGANDCVIFATHDRVKENIISRIKQLTGNSEVAKTRIVVVSGMGEVNSVPKNAIRIFDEFDFLFEKMPAEFEIRTTDRFYGTPKHQRNLADLKGDDILVKILDATNGHFHGRMWPICYDKSLLKDVKEKMPEEQLQTEILGNFWKVE